MCVCVRTRTHAFVSVRACVRAPCSSAVGTCRDFVKPIPPSFRTRTVAAPTGRSAISGSVHGISRSVQAVEPVHCSVMSVEWVLCTGAPTTRHRALTPALGRQHRHWGASTGTGALAPALGRCRHCVRRVPGALHCRGARGGGGHARVLPVGRASGSPRAACGLRCTRRVASRVCAPCCIRTHTHTHSHTLTHTYTP
jgi:hypothetical protein